MYTVYVHVRTNHESCCHVQACIPGQVLRLFKYIPGQNITLVSYYIPGQNITLEYKYFPGQNTTPVSYYIPRQNITLFSNYTPGQNVTLVSTYICRTECNAGFKLYTRREYITLDSKYICRTEYNARVQVLTSHYHFANISFEVKVECWQSEHLVVDGDLTSYHYQTNIFSA